MKLLSRMIAQQLAYDILNDVYNAGRLVLRRNNENLGVGLPCVSIKHARGRYIFIMNSDDYIHPRTIDIIYHSLQLLNTYCLL